MSYETKYPSAANLIGNVAITRSIRPTIRSGTRRANPDFSSSVPYYPGTTGKTLRINYTKEVSSVVTAASTDIVFSDNGIATIIATINAADSSNISASDVDGFLSISNLNPGKTHYLTIAAFTTPSSDAAPILGFSVDPFPGSTSFAGELAASPGSRTQSNPQTTTLIAKNDDLGTAELNRPLYSILQFIENIRAELNRDVVVYKDLALSFSAHNPGPIAAARVNDDSIRLFYPFPVADPPTVLDPARLSAYYRVLDSTGTGEAVKNFGSGTTNANAASVTNLFYSTNLTNFNSGAAFSTWGTPDGGTIVSSTVANKDKHPSTNITTIVGNIIQCSSATFVTHKVKSGDPVKLTAATLQPFDHSGWYAVDAVIDETHLAIRPMASSEETPDGTNIRPRWLNPLAAGTLRVAVGRFIPAGDIYIAIDTTLTTTSQVVRVPVGVPFINTLTEDRARDLSGNLKILSSVLQDHLNSTADRHPATSITGFTSATSWRDGSTVSGTNLKQTIEDILTDLKAQAIGDSGTGRVGAEAISIGGSAPNSISQGTVLTQLTALLTDIQSHVNQSSGAHTASAISYAGGPAWLDGTLNISTTVEAQLDRIIDVLSSTIGAFGVGAAKIGAAAVGTDLSSGTVASQISSLATNWLKMDRINSISARQIFLGRIDAAEIFSTDIALGIHSAGSLTAGNGLGVLAGGAAIHGVSEFFDGVTFDSNVTFDTDVTIDGVLGVTGLITATAGMTASGLITANSGVTAAANQHIVVSGTGKFKHGTRTLFISGTSFQGNVSTSWATTNNRTSMIGVGSNLCAGIPLDIGKRISAIRVVVVDNASGPVKLKADFISSTFPSAAITTIGSTPVSDGSGNFQILTVASFSPQTITSGVYLAIQASITTGSSSSVFVYGAEVDYDEP
jgi:hypothetical protein